MALSGKKLRTEIRTTLSALVEAVEPARGLQTKLLVAQKDILDVRAVERRRAEDAMRAPVGMSIGDREELDLITNGLDAIAKVLAGSSICDSVAKAIWRQDRAAKITPAERAATKAKSDAAMTDAHALGLFNRQRLLVGMPIFKSLDEAHASRELQHA